MGCLVEIKVSFFEFGQRVGDKKRSPSNAFHFHMTSSQKVELAGSEWRAKLPASMFIDLGVLKLEAASFDFHCLSLTLCQFDQ